MTSERPLVVLFGYESSTFTLKVRLALKLKQIEYAFVTVPSMMPRPILKDTFNLTYRKIPVLTIGRHLYCDTSLICEALEHHFPPQQGYATLYPSTADGNSYRALLRGFASFWTDRPLFRATTGLIPASVWRTSFGQDRAQLIGHTLDADKLEKKLPENLSRLDMHLSILEEMFDSKRKWLMSTQSPSLGDISLWYQLKWGSDIARGVLINDLTGGGTPDTVGKGIEAVFNVDRYPHLFEWYHRFERYMDALPVTEKGVQIDSVVDLMNNISLGEVLLPTAAPAHVDLSRQCGLEKGAIVSVAPDDTGRDNPTIGILLSITPEEVVIKPEQPARVDVHIHFPRNGFVVRPVRPSKL